MKTTIEKSTKSPRAKTGGSQAALSKNRTAVNDLMPPLMKMRSILVPVDFSAESEKALAYAVPFARQFGAKLTIVHVVEPTATPDFLTSFPLVIEKDKLMTASKSHLDRVVSDLAIDRKLVDGTLVRYGRSFYEITEAARSLKADLIIISTHGYSGLKHALLGSTAERVVQHAPCPVLVVRPREREFVHQVKES
jgi:nucleotide-binding universal stress UspA family protein